MGLFGKRKSQDLNQDQSDNDSSWVSSDGDGTNQDPNTGNNRGFDPWEMDMDQEPDPDSDQDDDAGNTGTSNGSKGFHSNILIVVLAVIIVVGLLYAGVSSVIGPTVGQSKEVISDLQGGINDLDPTQFVNVIEPRTRHVIRMIFPAVQGTTGVDLSTVFADAMNTLCSGMLPSDTNEPVTDLLRRIRIVPVNYGFPGKTRSVKCKIQFDGITYQYIRITIQKYEGESYINSITLIDK